MIKKKTVFILGAGTSNSYGYPLGDKLKQDVCDLLKNSDFQSRCPGAIAYSTFDKLSIGLSNSAVTIDKFLSFRSQQEIEVGRLAIAWILMRYEQLPPNNSPNGDVWCQHIFRNMHFDTASVGEFTQNQVSFITFNYDRFLEHSLFLELESTFSLPYETCKEHARKIPIIHIHGRLDYLPWQKDNHVGRGYGDTSIEKAQKTAKFLKLFYEPKDDENELELAKQALKSAEKIIFLGFGYHPENIDILEPKLTLKDKYLIGSADGFKRLEMEYINNIFKNKVYQTGEVMQGIDLKPHKNLEFLREHIIFD